MGSRMNWDRDRNRRLVRAGAETAAGELTPAALSALYGARKPIAGPSKQELRQHAEAAVAACMTVTCPACGRSGLVIRARIQGRKLKCRKCGRKFWAQG